jgi:hypothetical protein
MNEDHIREFYDNGKYQNPTPGENADLFPRKFRKVTRYSTKTEKPGRPGSRSKNERRIRREVRAARSANRK